MRRTYLPDSFAILLALTLLTAGVVAHGETPQSSQDGAKQELTNAVANDEDSAQQQTQRIQMAILLDTSNSMDGLINQARGQLWKIVNEFATAKGPNGQLPDFEVAVFEYGNNSLDEAGGHLRMVTPFTDDLDLVSRDLFNLTTNGGQEYCGHVLQSALAKLEWSPSDDDLKLVFIAGNEPFTQGTVDPYEMAQQAIQRGITVNTIFCGAQAEGINTGWQKGAVLADGSFINIDQNAAAVAIETAQDKRLAELSEKINTTYVFFGTDDERRERKSLQQGQDQAARRGGRGVAASRATAKAGRLYRAQDFDLASAVKSGDIKLEDIKPDMLPEELRDKSQEEIAKYLEEKLAERAKIQEEIAKLSVEREKFIAEASAANGDADGDTLQSAVLKAVHDQAARKNINFDKQNQGSGGNDSGKK